MEEQESLLWKHREHHWPRPAPTPAQPQVDVAAATWLHGARLRYFYCRQWSFPSSAGRAAASAAEEPLVMIWSFALLWLVCQRMTKSNSPGSVLSCLRKPLGGKMENNPKKEKTNQIKPQCKTKTNPKTPTDQKIAAPQGPAAQGCGFSELVSLQGAFVIILGFVASATHGNKRLQGSNSPSVKSSSTAGEFGPHHRAEPGERVVQCLHNPFIVHCTTPSLLPFPTRGQSPEHKPPTAKPVPHGKRVMGMADTNPGGRTQPREQTGVCLGRELQVKFSPLNAWSIQAGTASLRNQHMLQQWKLGQVTGKWQDLWEKRLCEAAETKTLKPGPVQCSYWGMKKPLWSLFRIWTMPPRSQIKEWNTSHYPVPDRLIARRGEQQHWAAFKAAPTAPPLLLGSSPSSLNPPAAEQRFSNSSTHYAEQVAYSLHTLLE